MAIEKYRSIDEMPVPWRDPDHPGNLRRIAAMMSVWFRMNPRPRSGVRRFRSVADANRERRDPYREAPDAER